MLQGAVWCKERAVQVQRACEWSKGGFPGSQPVSMDRQNLALLAEKPYKVSWKADGTRYMMLIDGKDEVYFVDRDNCVYKGRNINTYRFSEEFRFCVYNISCFVSGRVK